MKIRVPRVLRVLFVRLLMCEINLRARVRVACKHTCEDVNLLQVCTIFILPKSSELLNKNTLGVKIVRGQSEAALLIGRYVRPKSLISAEAKKATI